ncbi:unnamed protein product [Dracunculus medinensis]|uniref:Vesicular, overexpressed in cancer, prosurvival protein 1 n=1 Tax=Dracunculus medinensis TaxID=318479 RepID=A0A0N4U6R4_DRAME|nr:unnamed protein product [Dracunculus medinensis]
MAQEPVAPWSRWDPPGYQPLTSYAPDFFQNDNFDDSGLSQTRFVQGTLLEQRPSAISGFVECIYGLPNSTERIIEQCLNEVGCCATGCCESRRWIDQYRWAVALIVIFCIFVVIAVVVWFVIWLINRSKDKQLRQNLREMSSANSQVSLSGVKDAGYYPYVGGPRSLY